MKINKKQFLKEIKSINVSEFFGLFICVYFIGLLIGGIVGGALFFLGIPAGIGILWLTGGFLVVPITGGIYFTFCLMITITSLIKKLHKKGYITITIIYIILLLAFGQVLGNSISSL